MLEVSYKDPRPIYEQIRDGYRKLIATGVLAPGDKMPSVRETASRFAINPNTIQRAYRELEQEGFIYSVAGKGSFVARDPDAGKAHIESLLKDFDKLVRELGAFGCTHEMLIRRLEEGESEC